MKRHYLLSCCSVVYLFSMAEKVLIKLHCAFNSGQESDLGQQARKQNNDQLSFIFCELITKENKKDDK